MVLVRYATLKADYPCVAWGVNIVVPKGTRLIKPKNQYYWAVEPKELLIKLTGNEHDPKYRYLYVPPTLVENITP